MEDEDDEGETLKVFRLIISAQDAKPLKINGPCSVWDMASTPITVKVRKRSPGRPPKLVSSTDGVLKCTRIDPKDTEERKEQEAMRRAKQVIPRPPKKAVTVSRKITKIFD